LPCYSPTPAASFELLVRSLLLLHPVDTVPGAGLGLFLDANDFFLHAIALLPEVILVLHLELTKPLGELNLVACAFSLKLRLQIVGTCEKKRERSVRACLKRAMRAKRRFAALTVRGCSLLPAPDMSIASSSGSPLCRGNEGERSVVILADGRSPIAKNVCRKRAVVQNSKSVIKRARASRERGGGSLG
jgi:hypothetical protein